MYKLQIDTLNNQVSSVQRFVDNASIPFDPDNTDYANFKKEVLAGAELQDADGNTMTAAEAQEYVATLP
jgi:hypothetical protein